MLSYETCSKLGALFLSISAEEQEIELQRQELCNFRDFEPYAAFQRLDERHGGPITSHNVQDFLAEHKIYHTDLECEIFIKRFDTDGDLGLSYREFLNALLPTDNPHLRSMTVQRMNYKVNKNQVLTKEIEAALAKLIEKEISFYLNRDLQKSRLIQQKDFTFQSAFAIIDRYSSERIDYDNLKSFLENHAMYPTKQDMIAILRKVDRQNKGFISLEDLVAETKPQTDLCRTTTPIEKSERTSIASQQETGIRISAKKEIVEEGTIKKNLSLQKPLLSSDSEDKEETQASPLEQEKDKPHFNASLISTEHGTSQKNVTPRKVSFKIAEKGSQEKATRSGLFTSNYKNASISTLAQTTTKESDSNEEKVVKTLNFTEEKEKKKPLTFEVSRTNLKLVETLKHILVFTKELEIAKEELAMQPDFNLFTFFWSFNPEMNVHVSPNQFFEGLKRYAVFPNYHELELLFKNLDKDEDGKLRLGDFEDLLLSLKHEFSIMVRNRAPLKNKSNVEGDQLFSTETRRKIHKLLCLNLENEGILESLRNRLNKSTIFDLRIAFDQLDIQQEGFITFNTMKSFLESQNWYITNQDLSLLVNIFDENKDGKISYTEFVQTLSLKNQKRRVV